MMIKEKDMLNSNQLLSEFISGLKNKKVKLWVEGDTLRYKAPIGVVSHEVLKELADRKQEIIEYLKEMDGIFYEPIEREEEKDYYPLSAAQMRMFVLNQMDGESTAYNLTQVYKIDGALDKKRLSEIIDRLIDRHESLRTSYILKDGKPVQIIHKGIDFKLGYSELEGCGEQLEKEIKEFIRPYDLSKPPLFRIKLVKLVQKDKSYSCYLLYDMHHIISDGMSESILVDEINKLYSKESLPELKIQYKDYAAWQKKRLLSEYRMKVQREYWLSKFEGELPILNLPGDCRRPVKFNYQGGFITRQINIELTKKLHELALKNHVTLYTVLLSAYNVLLAKYTGQTDIIVGTPTAGRRHADANNLIGVFVSTLALRQYPEPEKTFSGFMKEVGENVLKAFDNQDYPFEKLVEDLNIKRDLGRNPVFDTMFIMQNMKVGDVKTEGLKISRYEYAKNAVQFDISVIATENNEGIEVETDYYSGLFKRETAEWFLRHYVNILEETVKNPDVRLCEIDMLTSNEKDRLLYKYNSSAREYSKDKTIQELFEEQAQKTPDDTALIFKNSRLTYADLNGQANSLARAIRQKGVKADDIVGIIAARSPKMLIAILAVLKAGGAYLPIDPEYPAERIRYMLADSAAKLLLTQPRFAEKISYDCEFMNLEDKELCTGDSSNLKRINTARNLAYIIYTSGSTGNPKGVMIEHRSVHNFMNGMTDRIEFPHGKKILALATMSFDIFVLETLLPLTRGMKVVIADENQQRDPDELSRLIIESKIDMLQATPSRIRLLLASENGMESLKGIKELMIGGETMPKDLLQELSAQTSANIYNMYGPTETTVWSTLKKLSVNDEINIGKPIPNIQIYILDENNHLQPQGVPGELCISGDDLARGYLSRPELTEKKFTANPFKHGTRMYRSGDIAEWLPNGEIQFLGRSDYQVKIRGYRIELGEIEACLLGHSSVQQAAVTAREGSQGNKYLCAYIVTKTPVTSLELRKYLLEKLPDYMVPAYFVQLDEFPLTPSGKIDRKALPEYGDYLNDGIEYTAPFGLLEKRIAEIWKKILHKNKIGVKDDFFDAGGNSLMTIQLVSELKNIGIRIKVSDAFKYTTIEKMAAYIISTNQDISKSECPVTELEAEKDEFRIIEGINENDDPYSWKQLDCFYRPMAILFESFQKGYFDVFLFYVSYYNCFMAEGWYSKIFEEGDQYESFFDFYNGFLKKRLGLQINKISVVSETDMHEKIKDEIDSGAPVLLPCDLFFLSYSANYMEKHHRHYLIIKGYSIKKDLYYILDNMHLEAGGSTIYKNFAIKRSEIYEMLKNYFDTIVHSSSNFYFWSINRCWQKEKQEFTYDDALREHYEHLKKVNTNQAQIKYVLLEAINQIKLYNNAEHCGIAVWLSNFKDVYYDLLNKFLSKANSDKKDIAALTENEKTISQRWSNIEAKLMERVVEKDSDFSNLKPLISNAVDCEKAFREQVISIMEKSSIAEKEKKRLAPDALINFVEKNNYSGEISAEKGKIRMTLSSRVIYNTWITRDNGPQMLIMLNNNNDFDFETRVTVLDLKGKKSDLTYHSGIIVKFESGIKILFGLIKETAIKESCVQILCPENGEKDVLFKKNFPATIRSLYLKVEKMADIYFFYIKLREEDNWENVLSLKSLRIVKCFGLIARTWEATDHIVEFDSIKYFVHD